MEYQYMPGRVLFRRKGLLAMHKGISLGNGKVIDTSPKSGAVERPLEEFSNGQKVFDGGYPGDLSPQTVIYRAKQMIGTPYSLRKHNCEHLVSVAHGLRKESPQLQAAVAIGIVAFIAIMATRSRPA